MRTHRGFPEPNVCFASSIQVLEGEIQASLYSTGAFHGFVKTIPNFDEATFHTYVRHTNWTRPQTYAVVCFGIHR